MRRCRPHGQQQRARCREHAKISLHFVRLLFVTRAEKTRIAAVPALFGLPCRQQRQRGYHLSDKRNRGSVSTFDRVVAGPPCRKAAACRARGLRSASCAQPCVSTIDVSESRVCRSRESGSGTPLTSWQRAEHGCSPAIIWRFTMRCVAAALRVRSMSSSAGARRGVNGDRSGCGKRPADPPLQKTSSLPTLRWRGQSAANSSLKRG